MSQDESRPSAAEARTKGFDRRTFLVGAGAVTAAGVASWYAKSKPQEQVFIAKASAYDTDLVTPIRHGLEELGLDSTFVKGKSVVLKPNLVEPTTEAPHINTHPAVVRAAAEVFRSWDAREVLVAEGQGHIRDTYLVLERSGLGAVLEEAKLEFIDLNHDEIFAAANRWGQTNLTDLHLPTTLRRADILVSMPKMKLHHWAGVTLSMKNLFGVMPGICYGWPKNVLHREGIEKSILDITATVKPNLAIIDGIIGMEGDGPIMGTAKTAGVLVLGRNLLATDATATRIMQVDPYRIPYLKTGAQRLGPLAESRIQQIGEPIRDVAVPFAYLDHPYFDQFRSDKPAGRPWISG